MPLTFNPDKEIPSLNGEVIFITGGTAGLGAGSVAELAKHSPGHIIFTGRNQKSADSLIERVGRASPDVKIKFIRCDISSLASVKDCAANFKSQFARLDILMLNAGIMATDAALSEDGYETQFATNHLGHALLIELLMPTLQATIKLPETGGDARIINLTSTAHNIAPRNGIDFLTLKTTQEKLGGAIVPGHRWSRYGQSKLANMVYAQALARHYPEILTVAIHPGIILTGLFDNVDFKTKLPVLLMSIGQKTPVERGHYNQCWAATCEKGQLKSGEYYEPIAQKGKKKWVGDTGKLGEELWQWTQKEIQPFIV